jgi:dihydroflavonol-4-reductase
MDKGQPGERYILNGVNMTYLELLNTIAQAIGARQVKWQLPRILYWPAWLAAAVFEWGIELVGAQAMLISPQIVGETFGYKWFDADKARQDLGWEPRVALTDAIGEAFAFYQAQGLI